MPTFHYNKQLLIAGLIFTLHNTEEAFGFWQFRFPEGLLIRTPEAGEMITAVALITLLAWIAIVWVIRKGGFFSKRFLLTTLAAVFLINAFIPHILGAIYLGSYFPGVVTAVLLYLPYVYWMLPGIYNEYDSRKSFFIAFVQGICISLFFVLVTQLAGFLIYNV